MGMSNCTKANASVGDVRLWKAVRGWKHQRPIFSVCFSENSENPLVGQVPHTQTKGSTLKCIIVDFRSCIQGSWWQYCTRDCTRDCAIVCTVVCTVVCMSVCMSVCIVSCMIVCIAVCNPRLCWHCNRLQIVPRWHSVVSSTQFSPLFMLRNSLESSIHWVVFSFSKASL